MFTVDTVFVSTESFQLRDLTGAKTVHLEVEVSDEMVAEGRTKTAADLIRPILMSFAKVANSS